MPQALTGLTGLSSIVSKIAFNNSFYLENISPSGLPTGNAIRSMFGWVKPKQTPANIEGLFGYGLPGSSSGYDHNNLYLNTDTSLIFHGDTAFNPSESNLVINEMNFVGMTWDGTTLKLYVNDNSWTATPGTFATEAGYIRVGLGDYWDNQFANLFMGDIVDIGIWDRALAPALVTILYEAGPQQYTNLPALLDILDTSGGLDLITAGGDTILIKNSLKNGVVSFWNLVEQYGTRYDSVSSNHLDEIIPTASFSVTSPTAVSVSTNFTDTSIFAVSWFWDFGDGNTSTDQNPTHTYNETGTYTVQLTINNIRNWTTSQSVVVAYPSASFTDNSPQVQGTSITFTDTSFLPLSWSWDFGDGSGTSTDQNPSYTYAEIGTYTVTLTINGVYSAQNNVEVFEYISQEVDLTSYFNDIGITQDGYSYGTGYGLDGVNPGTGGNNQSGTQLQDNYPAPLVLDSFSYRLPVANWYGNNTTNNVISCNGQTITLPEGQYVQINILGFAANGSNGGTFTVNYSDSSTQEIDQTFSDWFFPGVGGDTETTVFTLDYRLDNDGNPNGGPVYMYVYALPVDGSKNIVSITLTDNVFMYIVALDVVGIEI